METTRFELLASTQVSPPAGLVGNPFQLAAYRGSNDAGWTAPVEGLTLQPDPEGPPPVIAVSYSDDDIAGVDEANLRLFHVTSHDWEEATCSGYAIERFPEDNLIAVPVCQTGVFALWLMYLRGPVLACTYPSC